MRRLPLLLLFIALILSFFYLLDGIYHRDEIRFLPPIETEVLQIRNDGFGEGHFGASRKNGRVHKGLDISAPIGTPVRASKSGFAISKFDEYGYGKYVEMCHSGGLVTLYAHLKDTNVKWIKKVRQGNVVGWVGKTGNARYKGIKPHVHFEVRRNGIPQDPLKGYIR